MITITPTNTKTSVQRRTLPRPETRAGTTDQNAARPKLFDTDRTPGIDDFRPEPIVPAQFASKGDQNGRNPETHPR
jgi:hypothetical protein